VSSIPLIVVSPSTQQFASSPLRSHYFRHLLLPPVTDLTFALPNPHLSPSPVVNPQHQKHNHHSIFITSISSFIIIITTTNNITNIINMKSFTVAAVALAGVAAALPQGVTDKIAPKQSAPAGCMTNYNGEFSISIVNVTKTPTKRDLEERKVLTITLANGVLTDDEGRTGYIAANNQFQFDKPAQTGAIYTAGWSVCGNGTLALGNSAIFYQCLSGNFYNLYDAPTGQQCSQIYIDVLNAGSSVAGAGDGQLTAASASGAITQISDGQLQGATSTAKAVTQIADGQIQASTAAAPVTQISDGQIQATTGAPVTQISDGQIQATTGSPAMVTGKPVTQISDGQIQAPTKAPVTQISDGQIQAPVGTGAAGAKSNGTTFAGSRPTASYTGAASLPTFAGEMLLAAGALAVAFL
jgi:hypothetical protein